MVDFALSQEQQKLQANARAFAQNVLAGAPRLYAHLPEQRSRFEATLSIYSQAVSAGLIKGQIPTSLGGTANGMLDAAILIEEFMAVEPSAALTILGTGLGLTPLILSGSKEQHEKLLKPFLSEEGEPIASFMHSEPGGTANWLENGAQGLGTTAYKDGDEWVIDGEKLWTTKSSGWDQRGADLQCVVCRQSSPKTTQDTTTTDSSSDILILLITRQDVKNNAHSAYTILSDPELTGFKSAIGPHTCFTKFRVPSANLLSPPGRTFGTSAGLVGTMAVGIMRAAFEAALKFCREDSRGGTVRLVERQSVGDRLIDMKMKIEAARMLAWKALAGLDSENNSGRGNVNWEQRLEILLEAKVWFSEQAVEVVMQGMSVVGMTSYAKTQPFSRLLEDAAVLALFDGGNVGVRRRQIEKIFQRENYEPWVTTFGK